MKTKEFVELIKEVGYAVEETSSRLVVKASENGFTNILATVSKKSEYVVDTDNITFKKLDYDTRGFLMSTLYAYSQTAITERESIELTDAERVILGSLHHEFKIIKISAVSGKLVVEKPNELVKLFDLFGGAFDWVEKGKEYYIKDLLDAE